MQDGLQIAHMYWTEPRATMPVGYLVRHSVHCRGVG